MFAKILFSAAALLAFQLSAEELSIPEEKAFDRKFHIPEPLFEEGAFNKLLYPEWNCTVLNGVWKGKTVPFVKGMDSADDEGIKKQYFQENLPEEDWKNFTIPYNSQCRHPQLPREGGLIVYYRRNFIWNKIQPGTRCILDFRAAGERIDVWLNGKSVGKHHIGGENPFQYDITPLLRAGNNQITIRSYDNLKRSIGRSWLGGIQDTIRIYAVKGEFAVTRAMITPDLKSKSIDIRIQTVGKGKAVSAELSGGEKKSFTMTEGKDGWYHLGAMPIRNPRYWTPGDPYLYTVKFKDAQGNVVGYEHFGFRDFRIAGEWFLLNGKRIKPKAHSLHLGMQRNQKSATEMVLRGLRSAGVNMIRPHSGASPSSETMLNICDRIGLMVYADWHGINRGQELFAETGSFFKEYIENTYYHPCIVMWSLGNELYESPKSKIKFAPILDKLYGIVSRTDLQKRPISSSTGRARYPDVASGLITERTDFYDDHQYKGAFCDSWQKNFEHIDAYAKLVGNKKPKVNCEYGTPGDTVRYRGSISTAVAEIMKMPKRNTVEFKRKYIEQLRSPGIIGQFLRNIANYADLDDYVNRRGVYLRYGEPYGKRFAEIYRCAGEKCIISHMNNIWGDLFRDFDESGYYGINDFPISSPEEWRYMPLFYTLRRIYNPLFVCAGVFNQQPYSGAEEKITLTAVNDLDSAAKFKAVPQYRCENGKVITFPAVDFGVIDTLKQKNVTFSCKFPEVEKIDHGTLELYLFKDGKRVNDNRYPVTLYPKRNVALPAKCALYDSAGIRFRGLFDSPTTLSVLKKLQGRYTLVQNFNDLDQFTHLILGADSFDQQIIENGDKILNWVKQGGKLLVLEQSFCGKIPFLANYKINVGSPGTFVSIADKTHPIFKNFRAHDLDSWAGNMGRMAQNTLMPLDESLVASLPCTAAEDVDDIQSVLNDVKVGKGQIIFSQLYIMKRIGESGAAREYLVSLLEYFSNPEVSDYALPIANTTAEKSTYIEDKRAFFIDLSKAANRSFSDDKAGDQKGGWTDYGHSADFREMPLGITRLQGGVPFKIIDPAKNNDRSCIVLAGKYRPYFPKKVTGIPVGELLNSIYVLHISMYAAHLPGAAVRYTLHYEDGTTHTFTADTRYDIPDWWNAQPRRNALPVLRVGEKTLCMSEYVNPRPKTKIVSMDIESTGRAIPVIVAITGRLRSTSIIAGFGEE